MSNPAASARMTPQQVSDLLGPNPPLTPELDGDQHTPRRATETVAVISARAARVEQLLDALPAPNHRGRRCAIG